MFPIERGSVMLFPATETSTCCSWSFSLGRAIQSKQKDKCLLYRHKSSESMTCVPCLSLYAFNCILEQAKSFTKPIQIQTSLRIHRRSVALCMNSLVQRTCCCVRGGNDAAVDRHTIYCPWYRLLRHSGLISHSYSTFPPLSNQQVSQLLHILAQFPKVSPLKMYWLLC